MSHFKSNDVQHISFTLLIIIAGYKAISVYWTCVKKMNIRNHNFLTFVPPPHPTQKHRLPNCFVWFYFSFDFFVRVYISLWLHFLGWSVVWLAWIPHKVSVLWYLCVFIPDQSLVIVWWANCQWSLTSVLFSQWWF